MSLFFIITKNEKVVVENTAKYCEQTDVTMSILEKCKWEFGATDDPLSYALEGNNARNVQYLFEKGSKITEKACNVSICP